MKYLNIVLSSMFLLFSSAPLCAMEPPAKKVRTEGGEGPSAPSPAKRPRLTGTGDESILQAEQDFLNGRYYFELSNGNHWPDHKAARDYFIKVATSGIQPYAAAAQYYLGRLARIEGNHNAAQTYFLHAENYFFLIVQQGGNVSFSVSLIDRLYASIFIPLIHQSSTVLRQDGNDDVRLLQHALNIPVAAHYFPLKNMQERALLYLGDHYFKQGNRAEAEHYFKLAAFEAREELVRILGYCGLVKLFYTTEPSKALSYAGTVIEQNNYLYWKYSVMLDIGSLYLLYEGDVPVHQGGVRANYKTALEYLEPVAQQKATYKSLASQAATYIGRIYYEGDNHIARDFPKAALYFKQALEGGVEVDTDDEEYLWSEAAYTLAFMYANGEGVPLDRRKARQYARMITSSDLETIYTDGAIALLEELGGA